MGAAQRSFDLGLQYYVPAMQAGGDLGQNLTKRVSFGTPPVSAAAGILNDQSIAAAGTVYAASLLITGDQTQMGTFGRNVIVVASGAATSTVTVKGRDYLGQRMQEQLTLNGATSVVGKKAFRYIDQVDFGATAATTIDLGYGTKFGVPYATVDVVREYADGVKAAAGTLTVAATTDPQTSTSNDPRGLYVPTTTPDGSKLIEADLVFSNYVNSSGNGGLHGIRHYNG